MRNLKLAWRGLSFGVGDNYGVEVEVLSKRIREWKDGVTFWDWVCNLDLFKDDHKPSFEFRIEALNRVLFGVDVYNVHHLTPEEEQRLYPSV